MAPVSGGLAATVAGAAVDHQDGFTRRAGLWCNFSVEKRVYDLGVCFSLQIRTPTE
jgi:hypothetical protein